MIPDPLAFPRRLVKRHRGAFTAGDWCKGLGLSEADAQALKTDLERFYFQVRHVWQASGKWEVVFR